MVWSELFICNVCGKQRPEDATDWWIGWVEEKPRFNLLPWSELMARSTESVHLCGLNCALKETERWLTATGNARKRAAGA